MNRTLFLVLVGTALAVMAAGCIFSPKTEEVVIDLGEYSKALTHPDSLINDLEVSYQRREIVHYAPLLGNEFIFHFLPKDAPDIPNGEWNRDQDSTGTYRLFNDATVVGIAIALKWFAPVSDTIQGEAVQRVEVSYTDLKVDINGGETTLQVQGDRQNFYFQQGDQLGEDPDRWYIVDWEDLGTADGKPSRERQSLGSRIQAGGVIPVSLSELRAFLGSAETTPSP